MAGGVVQTEMRAEPAQAVFSGSGTLLYSAQKLVRSVGFDKSPYSGPSNTLPKAPCSLPFWLLLLLNSVLASNQNQERSSRVREEPLKSLGWSWKSFIWSFKKDPSAFGGHSVMRGREEEGKGVQKEGEENMG